MPRLAVATLALVGAFLGVGVAVVGIEPVRAAGQGVGFGTWAPRSAYGWHGSMLVGGVHTYCILPGADLPTGGTTDLGISTTAAGLGPQQLTQINFLVSTYGQTDDPVQAASVGWAVKAIANRDETLHAFGYRGDDLRGAINWTFSRLAPAANRAVQDLASEYYAEATALPAGPASADGSLAFTTAPDDPAEGTVQVATDLAGAVGTLQLDNAVFADTGAASREGAAGSTYPIRVVAPAGGTPFRVSATATLDAGFAASVHHFATAGGQDTAGPAGRLAVTLRGEDAADRRLTFAPVIATQVASRYVEAGVFVDDVTLSSARGIWPRSADGRYARVAARATVYRTESESEPAADPPPGAEPVGALELRSDPDAGPQSTYRVASTWPLDRAGFYTAVWQISADEQDAETRASLEAGYAWRESFGEQSQLTMVPAVSSAADPSATVGMPFSDTIVVDAPVPSAGLVVSASVYRAVAGADAAASCTPDRLVFASGPVTVSAPGRVTITAPHAPDFGTYFWQERATDAAGALVHLGACGLAAETSTAAPPTVSTRATPTAGLGGQFTDTATISGAVPASGRTEVSFELYRAPDGAEPASVCVEANLVSTTEAMPVSEPGEVVSAPLRMDAAGAYFWVERLWWAPPGSSPGSPPGSPPGSERRLIASGACGVEAERTVVTAPTLSTAAMPRAAVGEEITDTATVTGLGDGARAELVFFAYRNPAGSAPQCTADTLAAVTAPVAVTGSGSFRSPPVRAETAGSWRWIAMLQYQPGDGGDATVIGRGECGAAGETTEVADLAATGGGDAAGWSMGALGAILAGVAAIITTRAARRLRRRGDGEAATRAVGDRRCPSRRFGAGPRTG